MKGAGKTTIAPAQPPRSGKWLAWVIAAAVVVLFAGANAHLVYVSFNSQPDCVSHTRTAGTGGAPMQAAASAC